MENLSLLAKDLLYELDFFKYTFAFTFDYGRPHLSTTLGKLLSIGLSVLLIVLISQSDIINRRNPYIELKNLHIEQPTPTLLTAENFGLQFGLYDKTFNFIPVDPTIFSILAIKIKSSQTELMRPINNDITVMKYQQDPYLPLYGLEDNNIVLEGSINEANGTFLKVSIVFCDNFTANNTCKSQEEMNTFFQGKGLALAIFYRDSSIDFDDYDNPLKYSENTEMLIIDPGLTKQYYLNIKKGDFIDDKGIFFKQVDDTKAMINKDDSNFDFATRIPGDELAYFYIALSRNTQRTTRSYPKIGELFSSLLVVYNLFTFFGRVITKRFKKIRIFDYIFAEKKEENIDIAQKGLDYKTNTTTRGRLMKFKEASNAKICPSETNNSISGNVKVNNFEVFQPPLDNFPGLWLKLKNWLAQKKIKEKILNNKTNLKHFFKIIKDEKKVGNLNISEASVKNQSMSRKFTTKAIIS